MQFSVMISRIVVGCGHGSRGLGYKSYGPEFETWTCLPLFGLVIMVEGIERHVLKAMVVELQGMAAPCQAQMKLRSHWIMV